MHENNNRDAARKIARFRENIVRRVNAECDEITGSIDELREREFARFNEDAETLENAQIEERKRRITLAGRRDSANRKQELRAQYNARREALRLELFTEVRARLATFAGTPEYAQWLVRRAEPFRAMTLRVRECDAPALSGFALELDERVTQLGGFVAVGDGVRADETLERLLSEQEDWFLSAFASAE